MRCSNDGSLGGGDIVLNGERLEQVEKFLYLSVDTEAGRSMKAEMSHRVEERAKVLGALRGLAERKKCL